MPVPEDTNQGVRQSNQRSSVVYHDFFVDLVVSLCLHKGTQETRVDEAFGPERDGFAHLSEAAIDYFVGLSRLGGNGVRWLLTALVGDFASLNS